MMKLLAFFDSAYQGGADRWDRLRDAKPGSRQHYPLNQPSTLGCYDLARPEDAARVIAQARWAGIDGFVIDYARRDGVYRHDAALLASGCDDSFGLAFNWLNGLESVWGDAAAGLQMEERAAVLMEGLRGAPASLAGGGVVLIVDQPKQFAAPAAVTTILRRAAAQAGLPGLYLIANRAEDKGRFLSAGFDALLDPSPDQWHSCKPSNKASGLDLLEVMDGLKDSTDYLDRFFPYLSFTVGRTIDRGLRGKVLPRVFPAFHDWLAHPDGGATQLNNQGNRPFDPQLFTMFVENAMLYVDREFPGDQQMVFLQSWNGWLDGSQIEPSLLDGDLVFNAARAAIDRGRYLIRSRTGAKISADSLLHTHIAALCAAARSDLTKG